MMQSLTSLRVLAFAVGLAVWSRILTHAQRVRGLQPSPAWKQTQLEPSMAHITLFLINMKTSGSAAGAQGLLVRTAGW